MDKHKRISANSSRLEKFVKSFIVFVAIIVIVAFIAQAIIVAYFFYNPDSIGSWVGKLIRGFEE